MAGVKLHEEDAEIYLYDPDDGCWTHRRHAPTSRDDAKFLPAGTLAYFDGWVRFDLGTLNWLLNQDDEASIPQPAAGGAPETFPNSGTEALPAV